MLSEGVAADAMLCHKPPRVDQPAPARVSVSISRRDGRVVECTALEMRHGGNSIGGSNPSLSATSPAWVRSPQRTDLPYITCSRADFLNAFIVLRLSQRE